MLFTSMLNFVLVIVAWCAQTFGGLVGVCLVLVPSMLDF